ncbi:hypothetical protein [Gimesia aquarii]|uniref:Prepilin-type N-terminal cleavage/methylation domain-containing protein n=1 Tax=Gimesia aquarii TaxID=2527964 RepID=A0A517WPY0_9PLAN|nr:hypothetical protein [Gimesia aquarii]QDU07286.1 hypothetical protein V202x_06380 [Gimesia aquarii]
MKQLQKRTINTAIRHRHADRSGVTLMEVLMSVMIMGLGIIPLAALFPLSVQRSVQATQLTNATVLRYNAEALIDAFPTVFVFDPDGDTLDPNGHIAHQRRNRNYIVDPLGAYYAAFDGTGLEASFGNDGAGGAVTRVPRFHAGLVGTPITDPTAPLSAVNFFTQQDSWILLYEGIPTSTAFPDGINTTRDTIFIDTRDINSGIVDLTELSQTVSGLTGGRMLIYDTSGKQVQVRNITGANINAGSAEISFTDPLPDNELYESISKIRIEVLEQRYSYLLTVRRQIASDVASVDVVVFFRRNYDPELEAIHNVTGFVEGNTKCRVHFNGNVSTPPKLKKGGYIFDSINARWYRIQRVEDDLSSNALITLDQPIIQRINPPGDDSTDPSNQMPGIILMPNVVQVYPLGNKTR